MSKTKLLFSTPIYQAMLSEVGKIDMLEIEKSCWAIAEDDEAGQKWCEENNYPGYTSYASLSDLAWRSPIFEDLKKLLKSKEIGEDEEKTQEKKVQTITDDHIRSVDEKVSSKEKEIMTI